MALADKSTRLPSQKLISKRATKSSTQKNPKSTELIQDSDDEDSGGTSLYKKNTSQNGDGEFKAALPTKSKASIRTESKTMPDPKAKFKDSYDSTKQNASKSNGVPLKKQKIDISSSSDSDSGESHSQSDGEDSSDDSQSETSGGRIRRNAQSQAEISALAAERIIQRVRAPQYEPPRGFKPAPITLSPTSDLAETLSTSALSEKQLWHITIPSSVPVSSITEFSTKSVSNGTAILAYNGAEYGLIPESLDQTVQKTVLLPWSEAGGYGSASVKISKTLHLQQIIRQPHSKHGADKSPDDISRTYTKQIRQQPPGLKMRYRPFGVTSETSEPLEKSDSESTAKKPPQTARFRIPMDLDAKASPKQSHRGRSEQVENYKGLKTSGKLKRKKESSTANGLKEVELAQAQRETQHQSLTESPGNHTPAESTLDRPHRTIRLRSDSPLPPKPSKKTKKSHQNKEPPSPTTLSTNNPLTKPTTLSHAPIPHPNPQPPLTPSMSKNHQNLSPSREEDLNTQRTLESPVQLNLNEKRDDLEEGIIPRRVPKRNETAEERAARKAERRKQKERKEEGREGEW